MSDELEAWISRTDLSMADAESLRLLFEQRSDHVTFMQPSLQSIQSVALVETEDADWNPVVHNTDRYEDLGMLGQGGMGQVRRVKDRRLGRVVAMKIMRPELLSNPREVQRFVEEAQVGAQLQHPSICPVYELDLLPSGEYYFTMPEVTGVRFIDIIRNVHKASDNGCWKASEDGWTFNRLLTCFLHICEAIAFAHGKGVAHRDLKPQNVMIGALGQVVIMDWGLAKLVGTSLGESEIHSDRQLATRPGSIIGTPAYMPPEQAFGDVERVDVRADVYSLGAILYEILCGRAPYNGATHKDILNQMLMGPPKTLRQDNQNQPTQPGRITSLDFLFGGDTKPSVIESNPRPQALIEICERAMQHKPDDRYANASELLEVFQRYLRKKKK
ncbi:MAG: serine/threonine protein kinase [Myxococcota bacterium]